MAKNNTIQFSLGDEKNNQTRLILNEVYEALKERGYNPINQMVGYIISGDPTYITTHNKARTLVCRLDRDDIVQVLLKYYLIDD